MYLVAGPPDSKSPPEHMALAHIASGLWCQEPEHAGYFPAGFSGCLALLGGRATTAAKPRRAVGTSRYAQYPCAPVPRDAPHLMPRADPPGFTAIKHGLVISGS